MYNIINWAHEHILPRDLLQYKYVNKFNKNNSAVFRELLTAFV